MHEWLLQIMLTEENDDDAITVISPSLNAKARIGVPQSLVPSRILQVNGSKRSVFMK